MEILDTKIHTIASRSRKGEIGIEIECEGRDLPIDIQSKYWAVVADGSLRNGGLEYILRNPIMRKDVSTTLREWRDATTGVVFDFTSRTSVHVHVNIGNYTIREVMNVFTAFWLLENVLVGLNGKTREGNLFCLRVKDAESLPIDLVESLEKGKPLNVCTDHYRYAALNPAAITKYGSAEFRFIKGTADIERIEFWVGALYQLVTTAKNFKNPEDVLALYDNNITRFLTTFLPQNVVDEIVRTYPTTYIDMLGENYSHVLNLAKAVQNMADRVEFKRPYIYTENEDIDEDGFSKKPQLVKYLDSYSWSETIR